MWDSGRLFVLILFAMLSDGADAKDTGQPFEIGKKPGEKLVFVPKGTGTMSFSFELGNKDDYKKSLKFSLVVGGQKLGIGAITMGKDILFIITDDKKGSTNVYAPSQLNVTSTGFVINGTTADKYESKTPVKLEQAEDEQDAKYFAIKLDGKDVPPNFVIKGNNLNEYVIGGPEPTSLSTAPIETTVATSIETTVTVPIQTTVTAEPASETTDSGSNGSDSTMIWLALGLSIGSVVSNALFAQRV